MGTAYSALGDVQQAIGYCEQTLALTRQLGNRRGEALTAWNLGMIYEKQGDNARAAELMQILVDFETEIGHPDAKKHAKGLDEVKRRGRR